MKFYAVKKGRKPGVYRSWEAAKEQVDGYPHAEYKSFTKVTDATDYLNLDQETIKQVFQKGEDSLEQAVAKIQREAHSLKKQSAKAKKDAGASPAVSSSAGQTAAFFATIYTDGGTRNTGNYKGGHVKQTDKAAWAYLIEWEEEGAKKQATAANGEFGATNNKMELTALIEALQKLLELGFNHQSLLFVLDSQYVLNPITKGWLKGWKKRGWKKSTPGEIANLGCWQKLDHLLDQFTNTKFEWTKGHANNRGNEFVDHALNQFMDQMQDKIKRASLKLVLFILAARNNEHDPGKKLIEEITNIVEKLLQPVAILRCINFVKNSFGILLDILR